MSGATDDMAVRVIIHGRVQGVWFRAWTEREAASRSLRGWVRNRADGTVEAVFAGPKTGVRDMIAACHEGPPAARVSAIDEFEAEEPGTPGFEARPTV